MKLTGGDSAVTMSHSDLPTEAPARIQLLATKLHMPLVRPNVVSRSRLLDVLTDSLEHRLTLLSAPAGFGKTTLLSEWFATHLGPTGWLSLDSGDNDPARFWTYFIAALQTIRPGLGESAQALLCTVPAAPMETVLAVLINDLYSMGGSAVLVLDDYHAIDNPSIHSAMGFFLDHLPTVLHVVIATRVDPPIALAHLRAQRQLLELRADHLRFTREETVEFLNRRMSLGLSAADIEALVDRTEGWIVGLQLAALSLKGRPDTSEFIRHLSGSHRYILDYLVEEVLSLQPDAIQTFLLHTCILERFCGSLCDVLLTDQAPPSAIEHGANSSRSASVPIVRTDGQPGQLRIHSSSVSGQSILEYLERANLFVVPLDEERKWYRYHHLFADLLRVRLSQSYGEGHVQTLNSRAAAWYEENQFPAEAIEYAFAAHDTERAGRLIESLAESAWLGGEFYQVLHWIEALPEELMRSRPWLVVWYAWSRLQAGTVHGLEALIDHAESAARAQPDRLLASSVPQDEALMEQIAALRVTFAGLRQETGKAIELASLALERPAASNRAASLMARSNVLNVLGFAYYVSGELVQAEQAYREARRVAQESDFALRELLVVHKLAHIRQVMGCLLDPYQLYQQTLAQLHEQGRGAFFAAGYLYCGLSHLLYEWNRLDEAQQMIAQSIRLNQLAQVPHLTIDICHAQARLLLAEGDVNAAQVAVKEAAHLIRRHYCWPEVVSANQCYQVRLWLARGDTTSALRWVDQYRPQGSKMLEFASEMYEIARARVLLAQDLVDEAVGLLRLLAASAQAGGRTGRLIEILALLALGMSRLRVTSQRQDATRPELVVLERCLALARPEGYVRFFIDEGPAMAILLQQTAARGIEPDYVQHLLNMLPLQAGGDRSVARIHASSVRRRVSSPLVEPLSERELEVLRLVAEGFSNREIAERLVVATGTVKAHLHNICGKLDVRNRTQAILRAQQLGLLT